VRWVMSRQRRLKPSGPTNGSVCCPSRTARAAIIAATQANTCTAWPSSGVRANWAFPSRIFASCWILLDIGRVRGRGMTAQRKARKIGNARVTPPAVMFALVWHSHLMSAAPVSAQNLVKTPPSNAALSREELKKIDAFCTSEISAAKIPGAIVLIEQHDQPVYFKTFGLRDTDTGAPMTPDTIFPIHSMTKTITSFAVMMLIDQGRLRLDDPLAKYIPSFAEVRVGVETRDENVTPILTMLPPRRPLEIEDLLLHASGITYESNSKGLVKKAYAGITVGDFDNAEFVERIARLPLAEQPRTLWEYGHSTDVLGRVVEIVSGQSLYEFEKAQLLDPLGMPTP